MARILVDSDVLVDHLRGHRRLRRAGDDLHVSSITRAELLAGRGTDEPQIRRLLAPMVELPVDTAVAERGGRIRRTASVRLPDALIAATAVEHRLTLITRNVKVFRGIKGLKLRASSERESHDLDPTVHDTRSTATTRNRGDDEMGDKGPGSKSKDKKKKGAKSGGDSKKPAPRQGT